MQTGGRDNEEAGVEDAHEEHNNKKKVRATGPAPASPSGPLYLTAKSQLDASNPVPVPEEKAVEVRCCLVPLGGRAPSALICPKPSHG